MTIRKKEENEKPLLVVWHQPKADGCYYEQQYAFKFCKTYLQQSLQKFKISYKWNEISSFDLENQVMNDLNYEYILVIKDPLVILCGTVVKMMMQAIDKGYAGCGPSLNITENAQQIASPVFPVLSTTLLEELHESYYCVQRLHLEETQTLDNACVMYSGSYYQRENEKPSVFSQSNIPVLGYVVLKNSFVFTFNSKYGDARKDLVAFIPSTIRTLLDVGCSFGGLGKTIKETRSEIEADGIEMSEALANLAKPNYRVVFNCSIENFSTENKYEAVICGDVLEHLFDPWEQLRRINNLINPGGFLILSVPNAGHWSLVYDQLHGKFEYLPWGITCITHIRWFTETSIRKALEEAGFRIDVFDRQQLEPSPKGKDFIRKMVDQGFGNEQSLLTNEFVIRAVKK